MRGLLFLFILLLFGWCAFSGYWYNCKIKQRCDGNTVKSVKAKPVKTEEKKKAISISKPETITKNPTPLSISGYNFKNSAPEGNIYFNVDTTLMDQPIIDNTISPYLKEIINHLKVNPQNQLANYWLLH